MTLAFLPDDQTILARKLVELYDVAEASLLELLAHRVQQGIESPQWAERQLLEVQRTRREAQKLLAQLERKTAPAVQTAVEGAANRGRATAIAQVGKAATPIPSAQIGNLIDPYKLTALAADLTGVTTRTNMQILRSVDDIHRRIIADVTAKELAGVGTRQQLADEALREYARRGITGFIDRAGRRWEMSSYVEMASRAAAMNASIEGHVQQLASQGHDLVIVSDVPQECAQCRRYEGRVLSIWGSVAGSVTEDGKTIAGSLQQARDNGLFHPGCRHSIALYVPGVTRSFGETADPQGDRDRQKLRALERRVRAAKREELAAITPEGKRVARAKVKAAQKDIAEHVATSTAKRQRNRESITAAR